MECFSPDWLLPRTLACSPVDLKCLVGLGVNPVCLPFQYVLSCYLLWRLDIIIAATLSRHSVLWCHSHPDMTYTVDWVLKTNSLQLRRHSIFGKDWIKMLFPFISDRKHFMSHSVETIDSCSVAHCGIVG